MPDAIALGPLAIPPVVFVGLAAFFLTSAALRWVLPRRFDSLAITWVSDTLPYAVILFFVTWKLWPLVNWWDVIIADPVLILRMPGGTGGVLAGSAVATVPFLRGAYTDRSRLLPLAATTLVAVVSFALTWAVVSTATGPSGPAAVGEDSVRYQQLSSLDGATYRVLDGARPTMITFWATWCGPCVSELPAKEAFFLEHQDNLNYLYVNMTRSEASINQVRAFVAERQINSPVILDTNGDLASFFGVRGTPTTVFLDRHGTITDRWMGPADPGRLSRALGRATATTPAN